MNGRIFFKNPCKRGKIHYTTKATVQGSMLSTRCRSSYLNAFNNTVFASSLATKDSVSSEEILKRATLPSVESI